MKTYSSHAHRCRVNMRSTWVMLILNSAAIAVFVVLAPSIRMRLTSPSVSRAFQCASPRNCPLFEVPCRTESRELSWCVAQRRLVEVLCPRLPSPCATSWSALGASPWKAVHTRMCTNCCRPTRSRNRVTHWYPALSEVGLSIFPAHVCANRRPSLVKASVSRRISPERLTEYSGYVLIVRHSSMGGI
jgi:hypothetical protein